MYITSTCNAKANDCTVMFVFQKDIKLVAGSYIIQKQGNTHAYFFPEYFVGILSPSHFCFYSWLDLI
jgi:hypothetical protein